MKNITGYNSWLAKTFHSIIWEIPSIKGIKHPFKHIGDWVEWKTGFY